VVVVQRSHDSDVTGTGGCSYDGNLTLADARKVWEGYDPGSSTESTCVNTRVGILPESL